MLAKAFYSGLIANQRQEELIANILGGTDQNIKPTYSKFYKAFGYLNEDYKEQLSFLNGIAISEKKGKANPLTPAVYALHSYNIQDLTSFNTQLNFLQENIELKNDSYFWYYKDGVERFSIEAPWVSGISQGIIASVYIRKYKETENEEFLNIAKGAIAYCLEKENGLIEEHPSGFWIEEYPSAKGRGVLNGFIFFLIALGELASMGYYKEEFRKGINTLIQELPSFHKGSYILYGKNIPDLGNETYDKIHYHQLDALHGLTSISGFYSLKDYWRQTSLTDLS